MQNVAEKEKSPPRSDKRENDAYCRILPPKTQSQICDVSQISRIIVPLFWSHPHPLDLSRLKSGALLLIVYTVDSRMNEMFSAPIWIGSSEVEELAIPEVRFADCARRPGVTIEEGENCS
eukprot:COSAG02_NODE_2374_length_9019_cov_784.726121_4_plen_120_part_00